MLSNFNYAYAQLTTFTSLQLALPEAQLCFCCTCPIIQGIKLMRMGKLLRYSRYLLMAGLLTVWYTGTAMAQTTSTSETYQVTETDFSATSPRENCSGHYCARASIGDMSGQRAEASGGGSAAVFSPAEGEEPRLEVIVEPGESNLGELSAESTATKTMVVKILNYLGEGYTLQIDGNAPKFKNHALATPGSPVASDPGTEQFAINVAANTTPAVGTAPVQVPANEGIFGKVEDAYKTANLFKYTSGEVIARSDTESGRTDYTISMIVNISNATPAGHYSGDFAAVVVPAF